MWVSISEEGLEQNVVDEYYAVVRSNGLDLKNMLLQGRKKEKIYFIILST